MMTMIRFKEKEETEKPDTNTETKEENLIQKDDIISPISGTLMKLEDVQDGAFSTGALGKGAAILPEEGMVYAPVNGVVTTLFPTLHAIGITSDEGVEVLIHIGLDTVQLHGEGFEAFVKQGDHIEKGQKLIQFDMEAITKAGYCIETPIVITNSANFMDVLPENKETIMHGENLMHIIR